MRRRDTLPSARRRAAVQRVARLVISLGVGGADAFQAFPDELGPEPLFVARGVLRSPFGRPAPQLFRGYVGLLLALAVAELLEGVLERRASVQERLVLAIGRHQGGHGLWSLGSLRASPTRVRRRRGRQSDGYGLPCAKTGLPCDPGTDCRPAQGNFPTTPPSRAAAIAAIHEPPCRPRRLSRRLQLGQPAPKLAAVRH